MGLTITSTCKYENYEIVQFVLALVENNARTPLAIPMEKM